MTDTVDLAKVRELLEKADIETEGASVASLIEQEDACEVLEEMSVPLARLALSQAAEIKALREEVTNLSTIVASGIDEVAGAGLDDLEERATAAEAERDALKARMVEIGEIAGNCQYTDGKGHLQTSLDRIAALQARGVREG